MSTGLITLGIINPIFTDPVKEEVEELVGTIVDTEELKGTFVAEELLEGTLEDC